MKLISVNTLTAAANGEPRILDTDLANGLGLRQPLNFRATIAANRIELESHGPILTRRVNNTRELA